MSIVAHDVIAIHGAPRSGTSWLGQLFNSNEHVAYRYQPFFSYAFRGRVDEHASAPELREFFSALLATDDAFVLQTGASSLSAGTPRFVKADITHLVYKEVRFHHMLPHLLAVHPEFKAVGIVRDPRAVLASWARAPREFDAGWSLRDEWRHAASKNAGLEENWYGFERWKELARMFLNLETHYPERFRIVRYEDLVTDTSTSIDAVFQFAGLEATVQTTSFIEESTSFDDGDPYGVYRDCGETRHLTPGLEEAIAGAIARELSDTELARFLA